MVYVNLGSVGSLSGFIASLHDAEIEDWKEPLLFDQS